MILCPLRQRVHLLASGQLNSVSSCLGSHPTSLLRSLSWPEMLSPQLKQALTPPVAKTTKWQLYPFSPYWRAALTAGCTSALLYLSLQALKGIRMGQMWQYFLFLPQCTSQGRWFSFFSFLISPFIQSTQHFWKKSITRSILAYSV